MTSAWGEIDEWGPEKVLQVYDPDTGMKGVLVIENMKIFTTKNLIHSTYSYIDVVIKKTRFKNNFYVFIILNKL